LMEAHQVQCGLFRVDLRNECLWHGAEALHLRPKTFAVLRYFVTHPSRYGRSGHCPRPAGAIPRAVGVRELESPVAAAREVTRRAQNARRGLWLVHGGL
jgi:DNA-binding response OmpR family regulator